MKKLELSMRDEINGWVDVLNKYSEGYPAIGIEAIFKIEENNRKAKNLHPLDIFVLSTINRSSALTKGFCNEILSDNPLCAISILRMHFDTLLNLYSLFIVEDPFRCARRAMKGKHIHQNKFLDKTIDSECKIAESLSNSSLVKIDGRKIYDEYSSYIHLSDQHMKEIMNKNDEGRIQVTIPDGIVHPDELALRGCKDMVNITRANFTLWKKLDKLNLDQE